MLKWWLCVSVSPWWCVFLVPFWLHYLVPPLHNVHLEVLSNTIHLLETLTQTGVAGCTHKDVNAWCGTVNWKLWSWEAENNYERYCHSKARGVFSDVLTLNTGLLYVSGSEVIVCHSWLNPILWYSIITSKKNVSFLLCSIRTADTDRRSCTKTIWSYIPVCIIADQWGIIVISRILTSRPGSELKKKKGQSLIRAFETGHAWEQSFVASIWWRRQMKAEKFNLVPLSDVNHILMI